MISYFSSPEIWLSFISLTLLEIILGIDNIVFISLIVARVPEDKQISTRRAGLFLAMALRILMLLGLTWIIGLSTPIFHIFGHGVSWRDMILIAGGLFLFVKATQEIHQDIEGGLSQVEGKAMTGFAAIVVQIVIIDIIFSIDSVVTAIGIAEQVEVMIAAMVVAVTVMYFASGVISTFIINHPTTKMLALSFLILIGVALVADGSGFHIPRGYIYFAMAFATGVEIFNIVAVRRREKQD
ncbi:MAG: TerC family protein [Rhizobiales bacterium]|nr:TerC family protein [Hyphomicrobiales bacterium]